MKWLPFPVAPVSRYSMNTPTQFYTSIFVGLGRYLFERYRVRIKFVIRLGSRLHITVKIIGHLSVVKRAFIVATTSQCSL